MSDKIDLTETKEVLDALKVLTVRTLKNLADDGKISGYEILTYLGDVGILKKSLKNVSKIPNELKDLNQAEVDYLRNEIYKALQDANIKNDVTVIVDACIIWIMQTLAFFSIVRNPAPKAQQLDLDLK